MLFILLFVKLPFNHNHQPFDCFLLSYKVNHIILIDLFDLKFPYGTIFKSHSTVYKH